MTVKPRSRSAAVRRLLLGEALKRRCQQLSLDEDTKQLLQPECELIKEADSSLLRPETPKLALAEQTDRNRAAEEGTLAKKEASRLGI